LAKHVGKAKLADPVTVGNLAFSATVVACSLEQVRAVCRFHRLLLRFFEVVQRLLSEHEVSFVWVVFHWPSQNDVALLQSRDVLAFNETGLKFELVKEVVPQVMLCQHSRIAENDEPVFGPG
jgi:hypothetical protein